MYLTSSDKYKITVDEYFELLEKMRTGMFLLDSFHKIEETMKNLEYLILSVYSPYSKEYLMMNRFLNLYPQLMTVNNALKYVEKKGDHVIIDKQIKMGMEKIDEFIELIKWVKAQDKDDLLLKLFDLYDKDYKIFDSLYFCRIIKNHKLNIVIIDPKKRKYQEIFINTYFEIMKDVTSFPIPDRIMKHIPIELKEEMFEVEELI